MREGAPSPSIGTFTAPVTPGRVAVPPALTPIHAGRTRHGRCSASSLSTRSRPKLAAGRPARFRIRITLAAPTLLVADSCRCGWRHLHLVQGYPTDSPDDVLWTVGLLQRLTFGHRTKGQCQGAAARKNMA